MYQFPLRVKDALIVDADPYIRPLLAILNQFHRLAFVIVDQKRAQLFELFMGDILDRSDWIFTDVPAKLRFAGWYGLEEKRVMRHIEHHIHEHFKRVSSRLYQLYKTHRYDLLILGGQRYLLPEFEKYLHRDILDRVIERVEVEPFSWSINRVKERALEIEREFVGKQMSQQIETLITEASRGGLAVLGLEETLKAVNSGAVATLFLEDDHLLPGRECWRCGYLTLNEESCPVCQLPTTPMDALYDELVEAAVHLNGNFYALPAGSAMSQYDGVGAFLRFKV